MTTEVTVHESVAFSVLTVNDLVERGKRIQQVLKEIMKNGVDYGVIPGCGDRPGLLKPGAEKILSRFELAVKIEAEHIMDMSDDRKIRYRIISPIVHMHTGVVVGHGVGECSSEEEKYAWKKAVCAEEWNETDPMNRRKKWKMGKDGKPYQVDQIRTNPADVANTILKMCKKRSVVDGTLTATGASDMFEQGEDVTGDEDEGFNREGMKDQKPQPKEQQANVPRMPAYAEKWANKPISEVPAETLKKFLPGLVDSISDPARANFRERNEKTITAMVERIKSLEPAFFQTCFATELMEWVTDAQVLADVKALELQAYGVKDTISAEDWKALETLFLQRKAELTPKKK